MAVVINDVEIVDTPPTRDEPAPAERAERETPTLRPEDLEKLLRRWVERELRVRAD